MFKKKDDTELMELKLELELNKLFSEKQLLDTKPIQDKKLFEQKYPLGQKFIYLGQEFISLSYFSNKREYNLTEEEEKYLLEKYRPIRKILRLSEMYRDSPFEEIKGVSCEFYNGSGFEIKDFMFDLLEFVTFV